tara:strand:- start:173 stop:607 length:435 start_codon:yes stop_codon:yes gene_type:complete
MPLTLNFSSGQLNGAGSLINYHLSSSSPESPYLFTLFYPGFTNGTAYFNLSVNPNSNGNYSGSFSGSFNSSSFGLTGSLSGSFITSSGINPGPGYFITSSFVSTMNITQATSSFQLAPANLIPPNTLRVQGTGGISLVIKSNDA